MKKAPLLLGFAIALTVAFYMADYFLLHDHEPSPSLVGLFAALSLGIVWALRAIVSKRKPDKAPDPAAPAGHLAFLLVTGGSFVLATQARSAVPPPQRSTPPEPLTINCFAVPSTVTPGSPATVVSVGTSAENRPLVYSYSASEGSISGATSTATLSTSGAAPGVVSITCMVADNAGRTASSTATVTIQYPAVAAPPAPMPSPGPIGEGRPPNQLGGGGRPLPDRVSGTSLLLRGWNEQAGYGLYSYALLSRPPVLPVDQRRYQAFFAALVTLPPADDLALYVPRQRINVTYIPLLSPMANWSTASADEKAAYILAHYDYARGTAMLAALSPRPQGTGPLLLSVLAPLDLVSQPYPVLVQDMSDAQGTLMYTYVNLFVSKAARDQFWQPATLANLQVDLQNALMTAAAGLNVSRDAVTGWVKLLH